MRCRFYLSIRVARRVSGREQIAWGLFAVGFGSWLFAHSVWTTYELALGGLPPFPHWMQFFFLLMTGYSLPHF